MLRRGLGVGLSSIRGVSSIFGAREKRVADRFRSLPGLERSTFLTYVWVDGTGENLRTKTKVAKSEPNSVEEIGNWGYDGSSTYQASGENSDLQVRPVRMCPDPFGTPSSKIVLCDVYDDKGSPVATNHRNSALRAFEECSDQAPTFGFEQEYTLMREDGKPFGFPQSGLPEPQGPYYCSVGAGNAVGRDICDSHLFACQYAGLDIWGTNGEVMPGQWEFQTGPIQGVDAADTLWLARFLLHRVAEEFGVCVSLDPKPADGDWNGAGCHANFNTKAMLEEGGIKVIYEAMEALAKNHDKHIRGYDPKGGKDNVRRLTGLHETASIDKFTFGEASRQDSVRIPRSVVEKGRGFLEDRRPSANMDPYVVADLLMRTVCLHQ